MPEQNNELLDKIKDYFDSKQDYIEMLGEVGSLAEWWFGIELRYLFKKMYIKCATEVHYPSSQKYCDLVFDYQGKRHWMELKAIGTISKKQLNTTTLEYNTRHYNPSLGRLKEDIERLYEIQDGVMKWWLCFVYPTPDGDSVWERIKNLKNMEKERIIWVGERKSPVCSILLYQVGGRS